MAATDELKRQLLEIERLCANPKPPNSGFTPATRTRKICDTQECSDLFRGRQEALKRGVDNLVYARGLVLQPPASLPQFEISQHAREMLEAFYAKFEWPEENEVSLLASALDLEEDDVIEFYDTVIDNVKAQEKMSKMLLKKIGQECARLSR
ncbi:hypothetical protein CKM354_000137000 [Cercospora kikuchii]|uniref:Uncharacterized protein n=1 Tax=Cercospora kikuchii TaxID=84275 RepID=A0A9P3CAT2_9PEZI|nr:uncharacterized protein CKM354_000137000 [Cercospora kikuchii]GIZ37942.1 hypothetical protein CKM354_000137000 [Cercospora kikuchii]